MTSAKGHEMRGACEACGCSSAGASFPASDLAKEPLFLSGIHHVSESPLTDGSGRSSLWAQSTALELTRDDRQVVIEPSEARLLYDDDCLYVLFRGVSRDHGTHEAKAKTADENPWEDDSYEIFLDPGLTRRNFYQYVSNTLGTRYQLYYAPETGSDRTFATSWQVKVHEAEDSWSMEIAIPFAELGGAPRAGELWGVNIMRNNRPCCERLVYRTDDINDSPEKFAQVLFVDDAYLKRPRREVEREVADQYWKLPDLRKKVSEMLATLGELSEGARQRFQPELDRIRGLEACVFLDYYKEFDGLNALVRPMEQAVIESERMVRLFAPGTKAAQRHFAVFAESPMTRIQRESYLGNGRSDIDLELAGGEVGSFQLAVIPQQGYDLQQLTVTGCPLTCPEGGSLPAESIRVFTVEDVRTVQPGKVQQNIPDVLRPGNVLPCHDAGVLLFFVEVRVAAHTASGRYAGVIRVSGGEQGVAELPVTVRVCNFDLPAEHTLSTLFSFSPEWAEMFYGKPMPVEKRRQYFDFLMEHRLDPTNLWPAEKTLMTEEEMRHYVSQGMKHILFRVNEEEEQMCQEVTEARELLKRNGWMDRAIFFGFDECLNTDHWKDMQKVYAKLKEIAPEAKRFCTMAMDPRGEGFLEMWCPFFGYYKPEDVPEQERKGRQVWWYTTDYPLNPWPNFNLNQDPVGPRMIVWITWKNRRPGLLYWGTNREWVTNSGPLFNLSEKEIVTRDMEWLKTARQNRNLRWPEIPWVPVFMALNPESKFVSATNGGANLMYPGPDWQPLPALRLKIFRDGLQDHAAMTLLKRLADQLEDKAKDHPMLKEIRSLLDPEPMMVAESTVYAHDPQVIEGYRRKVNDCIERVLEELK